MVTIQFFLKNPKERKSPIYIAVHVRGKRLTPISIGESILCDATDKKGKIIKGDWDKERQRVRKTHDFADELNNKIEGIYLSVGKTFRQMLANRQTPTVDDLQELVKPDAPRRKGVNKNPQTVQEFCDKWWKAHLTRENRGVEGWEKLPETKQKGYSYVRQARPVVERINEFRPNALLKDFVPASGDAERGVTLMDDFIEWLQNNYPDIQDTTLRTYTIVMRRWLKFAGLPYDWLKDAGGGKPTKYSLTWDEILLLKNTKYSKPEYQDAAEVAIIISQMALRWSDFSTLNELHFEQVKTKKHGLVWCVNKSQAKTGNAVLVPAPPISEELLKKHNFVLPIPRTNTGVAYRHILSDNMKEAAAEAKLTRKIRQTKIFNKEVQEFWKPLHELLSPHDLRHTSATLIMQATKNRELVKHQLGHAVEGVTDAYIHLDTIGVIDDLLDAWKKIEAGS